MLMICGRILEPASLGAAVVLNLAALIPAWAAGRDTDVGEVASPDGCVVIGVTLRDGGIPCYSVHYDGQPVICPSQLGLKPNLLGDFQLVDTSDVRHDSHWINQFGELKHVPDRYHQLTCTLRHESGRRLTLQFRAYDEGAALRYIVGGQTEQPSRFTGERTEFCLPEGTLGYEEHGTEGPYELVPVDDIRPWCERPLTLKFANDLYASIAEASNHRHPRMLLSPVDGAPRTLISALGGRTSNTATPNQRHDPSFELAAGQSTPWRVLILGRRPGDLLENNYLLLNLNPPCALEDTSWINPGKVMRDTALTTENSKAIIDFAETAGLAYTHLDSKWYGSEDAASGDATAVRAPDLDIEEIVHYGRNHGVGLTLYVDRRQIKSQRDEIFPWMQQWGVKGLKLGFVDVGSQVETEWITETIEKAAQHQLMLNIHDGYRATGNNRTYPNLMTVEGIRGNERMPTPEHNCTLPFTRYVCGIGDYTICYYNDRIQTTHAHQLAMAVVSFSPLQWIFWYDTPDMWDGEPEVEFFRRVPTVWDETRVIHGEIGRFATIARRSGDDWFLGTINNSRPRTLRIPLEFLDTDKSYTAHVYDDDPAVETRTQVAVDQKPVDSGSMLTAQLLPGGGQAIWVEANEHQP